MSSKVADLRGVDAPRASIASDATASAGKATIAPVGKWSRRRLLKTVLGLGTVGASGVYGREIEPFWVEWHDVEMPLRHLPKSFDGFRIVQLTDLHASDVVPMGYLRGVIQQVIKNRPHLVVVTGDLVTHALNYVAPICDALGELRAAGIQTVATLGNHDYNFSDAYPGVPTRLADAIEGRLRHHNIPTLRNASLSIDHADGKLWLVGLEDLWSGRFSPQIAFAGVDPAQPIIGLSHNPDTAFDLDAYGAQWTLSGHTHGGQIRVPGIGQLVFNVQNRQFQQGQYLLPHSKLYVARGVGYFKQVRVFCRPEVPTFVLRCVEA
jgi:predicted MPP superfamily phosphohydrolase